MSQQINVVNVIKCPTVRILCEELSKGFFFMILMCVYRMRRIFLNDPTACIFCKGFLSVRVAGNQVKSIVNHLLLFTKNSYVDTFTHFLSNVECLMFNVECQMTNVTCRMPNAECRRSKIECRVSNFECRMSDINAEFRMTNVKFQRSDKCMIRYTDQQIFPYS